MITVHLRIHGRVQGVGFRYAMQAEAWRRDVRGWVRNRRDGTVEAIVQGSQDAVDAVVAWAHHGPPSARVTNVQASAGSGTYETFEARPTE